jgi:hypothetical protein
MKKKMAARIYKPLVTLAVALALVHTTGLAQGVSLVVGSSATSGSTTVKANVNTRRIEAKAKSLGKDLELSLDNMGTSFADKMTVIAPKIISGVSDLVSDVNVTVNTNSDGDNSYSSGSGQAFGTVRVTDKYKSYSKTYPIVGNDRIKLNNQYGKIQVNTWDRHEVKVDVQIKAEAEDDATAQKLLDGVQIRDSKDGDDVNFHTEIERVGSSFKLWDFGNNKKHKVEINYTVYMPAHTDLNVEDSYGAIELPDLSGKVKISCSYGSVSAQSLSNPSNEIEGSYGSLKTGMVNGTRLDYSYGSVSMDGCNNLKADLSYGSFKIGKLTGSGEFDISYVGGFKIDELGDSFKKLKVDASYSSVSVGVPGSGNFSFDITTTYGGFDYNDGKATITSKNPPDGTKHIGPTRNYKGYFGKSGADALVNIHTSYGGVSFE